MFQVVEFVTAANGLIVDKYLGHRVCATAIHHLNPFAGIQIDSDLSKIDILAVQQHFGADTERTVGRAVKLDFGHQLKLISSPQVVFLLSTR